MEKRKVLGRGISSLIPSPPIKKSEVSEPTEIPTSPSIAMTSEKSHFVEIDRIRMNPRQPRKIFAEGALKDLVQSVKEKGVLQPLLVTRKGMHYELIAGERRYRAAKESGLKVVPVRILEANEQEQLEIALIENLIREDLNPIEEAKGYEKLQREFSLTHDQISQKVSKDRTTITNALRLLKLPLTIQQEVQRGTMSMGHARALLPLDNEKLQLQVAQRILQLGLSVRQTEKECSELLNPKKIVAKIHVDNPNLRNVKDILQQKLGTKIEIREKGQNKGEIKIQYFNQADLTRMIDIFQKI